MPGARDRALNSRGSSWVTTMLASVASRSIEAVAVVFVRFGLAELSGDIFTGEVITVPVARIVESVEDALRLVEGDQGCLRERCLEQGWTRRLGCRAVIGDR